MNSYTSFDAMAQGTGALQQGSAMSVFNAGDPAETAALLEKANSFYGQGKAIQQEIQAYFRTSGITEETATNEDKKLQRLHNAIGDALTSLGIGEL